jgi:hypothetical protein
MVRARGERISAIREYILREPGPSRRQLLTILSGCVLVALGLLYAGLPQTLQISLVGLGVLNSLLGVAEFVPRDRVRTAGALRITAYFLFSGVLALLAVMVFTAGN